MDRHGFMDSNFNDKEQTGFEVKFQMYLHLYLLRLVVPMWFKFGL